MLKRSWQIKTKKINYLVIGVIFTLSSCMSQPVTTVAVPEDINVRLSVLEAKTNQLQNSIENLLGLLEETKKIKTYNERLKISYEKLKNEIYDLKKEIKKLHSNLRKYKSQNKVLENKIKLLESKIRLLENNQRKILISIDNINQKLEKIQATLSQIKSKKEDTSSLKKPRKKSKDIFSLKPEKIYSLAYKEMENGNFQKSLELFKQLYKRFPYTQYAPLSLYWIAEIYYSQDDYENALKYYLKLVKNIQNLTKYQQLF